MITLGIVGALMLASVAFAIRQTARAYPEFFGPVKLSGGQTAQVLSVRSRARAWAPDGKPKTGSDIGIDPGLGMGLPNQQGTFLVHIRAGKISPDAIIFRTSPDWTNEGFQVTSLINSTDVWVGVRPTHQIDKVDLHLGFGSQPFKLVGEDALHHGTMDPTPEINHENGVIRFNGLSVRLRLPLSVRRMQTKVAIVTTDGKTFYDEELSSLDTDQYLGMTTDVPHGHTDLHEPVEWFQFPTLKVSDVARVQLMARPIEWVDFTDIHLKPN